VDEDQVQEDSDPVDPKDAPPDTIDAPSLNFNQIPEQQQGAEHQT
ncbi:uncharacterized protein METZ01_LOCUS419236, partial [marine metagenome]